MRQLLGSKTEKWNVERLFGVKGVHHHQPLSVHPLEGCRADKRISWRVLDISLILVFVFVFLVLESPSVCPVSTHWRAVERTNGSAGVRARNLFFQLQIYLSLRKEEKLEFFRKRRWSLELVFLLRKRNVPFDWRRKIYISAATKNVLQPVAEKCVFPTKLRNI